MMALKNSQKSNLLIGALVLVALVLGVMIYKQKFSTSPTIGMQKTPAVTTSPQGNQKVFTTRRPTPAGLTSDEKLLLAPPAPNADQKTKADHFAVVVKLAKEANVLDLNKCEKANPLVLKIKNDSSFKIKNSDSVPHTVWVNQDHQYVVAANSTKTISAAFGRGPGSYGYLCDNLGGVVGFFLVTP